jgi:hypothetical protein
MSLLPLPQNSTIFTSNHNTPAPWNTLRCQLTQQRENAAARELTRCSNLHHQLTNMTMIGSHMRCYPRLQYTKIHLSSPLSWVSETSHPHCSERLSPGATFKATLSRVKLDISGGCNPSIIGVIRTLDSENTIEYQHAAQQGAKHSRAKQEIPEDGSRFVFQRSPKLRWALRIQQKSAIVHSCHRSIDFAATSPNILFPLSPGPMYVCRRLSFMPYVPAC